LKLGWAFAGLAVGVAARIAATATGTAAIIAVRYAASPDAYQLGCFSFQYVVMREIVMIK
jgi:hypothetical protein